MKYIKAIIWLLFAPNYLIGQNSIFETTDNPMEIRVMYEYTQQATKNDDPFFITDTMALDIGVKRSVYYDYNLFSKDSLAYTVFSQNSRRSHFSWDEEELERRLEMKGKSDKMEGDRNGETSRVFKDLRNNNLITLDRDHLTLQYKYKVEEKINHNWELTEDTDTIFNYTCYEAITHFRGRTYHAWFTLDIPISEGPWKFFGLPGLILRVEDEESLFSFTAIGLENTDQSRYYNNNPNKIKAEKISFSGLNQIKQKQVENILYAFIDDSSNEYFFNAKNPVKYNNLEISE